MNVPDATISSHSQSYSSWLPSTQWIAAGWVSSAIFSTQRIRCSFVVNGFAMLVIPCFIPIPLLRAMPILRQSPCGQGYTFSFHLAVFLEHWTGPHQPDFLGLLNHLYVNVRRGSKIEVW